MSPEKAASIRLRIVSCIEELLHCFRVEGAKISMSRCRRSHQNWCRVISVGSIGGGGNDGLDDCGLEVAECRFVARSEEVMPSGAEIVWFVEIHR